METIRNAACEQLVALGFPRKEARLLIISGDIPVPLTEEMLENIRFLVEHTDLSAMNAVDCMMAAYFIRRPASQVRFMAQIPDAYAFDAAERERYFSRMLHWDMCYDLRSEIDAELAGLLPDEGARERIYREMYLNGAWWNVDFLKDIMKALRRTAVDEERMRTFVNENYPNLFSFYSDTVRCIESLEEVFLPEHVQAVLESAPFLPREFSPHFDPQCRPEEAVKELAARFPGFLKR